MRNILISLVEKNRKKYDFYGSSLLFPRSRCGIKFEAQMVASKTRKFSSYITEKSLTGKVLGTMSIDISAHLTL